MRKQTTLIGGHLIWNGERTILHEGQRMTPAQKSLMESYPDSYVPYVPVLPHCGFPNCITPSHLHPSIIYSRLQGE